VRQFVSAWLVVVLGVAGCASQYVPLPSPRIKACPENGFCRDGKQYKPSVFFDFETDDLVAGNPRASAEVSRFRTKAAVGGAMYLTGLVGIFVFPRKLVPSDDPDMAGWMVLGSGLSLAFAGLILAATGRAHLLDGINIYNDAIEAKRQP
jgi:hypothetical protein